MAGGTGQGPSLPRRVDDPDVSTTLTLTPLDGRGREILDRLETSSTLPFRLNDLTGARSYWINADGAPDGYEAAPLDRLAPDWHHSVPLERIAPGPRLPPDSDYRRPRRSSSHPWAMGFCVLLPST